MSRASCLYCGAALRPEEVAAAVRAAEPAPQAPPADDRLLIIVELGAVEAARAAGALRALVFDVQQWARRGRFHLHRIAPAEAALAEAEALVQTGLPAYLLSEATVRAATTPLIATAGALEGESLRLRLDKDELRVTGGEVLLAVRGPIRREYAGTRPQVRWGVFQLGGYFGLPGLELGTATLEPGHRFHLHLRHAPRPLEVNPAAFEFPLEPGLAVSSEQRLAAWLETMIGLPVDESFKHQTPALAPAEASGGPLFAVEALARSKPGSQEPDLKVLDNLAQFRFYSAWRGLLERRRAGLTGVSDPMLP